MATGIDELDELVDGGKTAAADVKAKWKMKLGGVAVAGIGGLVLRYVGESQEVRYAGIGAIVVGVLMILGTEGIKWAGIQVLSAGKSRPRTKL